jgi:hypothetical protein
MNHHHSLFCLSLPHLYPTLLTGSLLSFTSELPLRCSTLLYSILAYSLLYSVCSTSSALLLLPLPQDKPGTAYSSCALPHPCLRLHPPQEDLFLAHDPPVLPLLQDEQRNVSPPTLTPLAYSPPASQ